MLEESIIFIADDDPDDRELFVEAVAKINDQITCITACNGQDAISQLQKKDQPLPDFIFLDLNMPRISGKQCLAELRKTDRLKNIPVIIYTTAKMHDDLKEIKRLGAAYILIKPNKFDELVDALSLILLADVPEQAYKLDGIISVL